MTSSNILTGEVSWKAGRMGVGKIMVKRVKEKTLAIEHLDLKDTPYLASVMDKDQIVDIDLYPSLGEARRACEANAKEAGECSN